MQEIKAAGGEQGGVSVAEFPCLLMQFSGRQIHQRKKAGANLAFQIFAQKITFAGGNPPTIDCEIEGIAQFQQPERQKGQR